MVARSKSSDEATSAAEFLPARRTLPALRTAAETCRGCELYRDATQVVFGEGPKSARLMFVGEMPGDQEDLAGHPFVGPAGALLNKALAEVGLNRNDVYVTNAVKHFHHEPRGTRRLHSKPKTRHVKACHPWLEAELDVVDPEVIVCLGATAAQALLGSKFRITQQRGELLAFGSRQILATWHPAAVLRAPDHDARARMRDELVADLKAAFGRLSL